MLNRRLAVRRLVGAEREDLVLERRVGVAEPLGLAAVVLVDDLLDRDGAGHRRLFAEQRRRGAQRVTGDMPQRMQQGRPHPPRPHQFVEGGEMANFLLGHMADLVARPPMPHNRELAVIDAGRAVFAGMVDPHHARDLVLGHRIAGEIGRPSGIYFRGHAVPRLT